MTAPNLTHRLECTCHLEPSFNACDPYDDIYEVMDAECEVICTSTKRSYAELVAHALRGMTPEACRVHEAKNNHSPEQADAFCTTLFRIIEVLGWTSEDATPDDGDRIVARVQELVERPIPFE